MNKRIYCIGITGGTGSGKTSFAKAITSNLKPTEVAIIEQDSYYKDLSMLSMEERSNVNYDHPDSIDFEFMKKQLTMLSNGENIKVPIYDYKTHTRKITTNNIIKSQNIIIIEGILIFNDPELRKMLDLKIYIDAPDDIRLTRRVNRDIHERKRTLSSIIKQFHLSEVCFTIELRQSKR